MPQESIQILPKETIGTFDKNVFEENVSTVNQLLDGKDLKTFSLYIRAPNWIKDRNSAMNKMLEICPKIKSIRHPRQKSADYCFVDFATANDRDQSYEEMKNNPVIAVKTVTKDNPELLKRKKKKIAEKREAKALTRKILVKHEKNEIHENELTNQIIIAKIPSATTTSELKEHFQDAVDINMKLVKNQKKFKSAIITFATPIAAKNASQNRVILHGEESRVRLNIGAVCKKLEKNEKFNYKMLKKQNKHEKNLQKIAPKAQMKIEKN